MRIAVCETVAEFNSGAASEAVLMRMCDISEPGENSMRAFRSKDNLRIQSAAQKVSQKYRLQRQKQRFQGKAKPDSASYLPGSFGLAPEPETVTIQKTKKRKRKSKKEEEVQIKFVVPLMEVVGSPKHL